MNSPLLASSHEFLHSDLLAAIAAVSSVVLASIACAGSVVLCLRCWQCRADCTRLYWQCCGVPATFGFAGCSCFSMYCSIRCMHSVLLAQHVLQYSVHALSFACTVIRLFWLHAAVRAVSCWVSVGTAVLAAPGCIGASVGESSLFFDRVNVGLNFKPAFSKAAGYVSSPSGCCE